MGVVRVREGSQAVRIRRRAAQNAAVALVGGGAVRVRDGGLPIRLDVTPNAPSHTQAAPGCDVHGTRRGQARSQVGQEADGVLEWGDGLGGAWAGWGQVRWLRGQLQYPRSPLVAAEVRLPDLVANARRVVGLGRRREGQRGGMARWVPVETARARVGRQGTFTGTLACPCLHQLTV